MEKDLKEELMRVRAREKRYRNTAEAQITSLQEQLETIKEAESRAEVARIELENRCRKLEEEKALLQNRADSFQAQLETMKEVEARAESCGVELEKLKVHCQRLESENILCREFRQKLELAEEEARKLREKLSTLSDAAAAAGFLQGQPQNIREILRAQGYAVDNLAAFFCRCGNLDALLALWQAVRHMVMNGAASDAMKDFLNSMLQLYNQSTPQKLKYVPVWYSSNSLLEGFMQFMGRDRVLLPGLADSNGVLLVEPLLESKH